MKRYESYKDSGVKWLGEIPGHWEVKRLRFLFSENKTKNTKLKEKKQLQFRYGEIVPKERQDIDEESSKIISKYTIVKERDIIINGLNLNYDFISQRVAMVRESGIITSAYISLRSKIELITCFYNYFMKAMDSRMLFHGMGSGIRLTLSYDNLKNLFFPYPDIAEQTAIANYLDSVTSKIDEAISQQQKMIDLLNERKQIIIQNAVTKGLDPNAKMKDSGVEWIGEIPENWEVYKFGRLISLLTDYTANGSFGDLAKNIHYQNEGYARLVRLTDLRENLNNIGVWVNKHGYDFLSKSWLKGGELLIANVGAYSGLPCIMPKVPYPTTLAPNMFLLKLNESKIYTKYIYYLLLSNCYFNWLQTIATSSAQPKLNKDNIRQLIIIHPINIKDQYDIVLYIKKKLHPIDESISQCNKMISLLQERKQIIINDVVTGKVKVI